MTEGVRWRAEWVVAAGPVGLGVTATIGAPVGLLLGRLAALEGLSLGDAAALGAVLGTVAWLAVWVPCLVLTRAGVRKARDEDLFEDFRRSIRGSIEKQSHELLDGRKRLDAPFEGYRKVSPPRQFEGSIRQRSDLNGAVEAASAPGQGPRLLVVGPPGYGKTVALLDIAQYLARREGPGSPAPVVFNLGSWRASDSKAGAGQADHDLGGRLTAWMVRMLCRPAGPLPRRKAETVTEWIEAGRIAVLLDGLDEIADEDTRRQCVEAISDFIRTAPDTTAVVVASRESEYEAFISSGKDRLAVNAAIRFQPLRPSQVATRLQDRTVEAAAKRLAALSTDTPDHPVAELLRVPLWLWMAITLDTRRVAELEAAADTAEAQRILADAYVERTFVDLDRTLSEPGVATGDETPPDAPRCRWFLAAIAGFLADPRTPDSVTFRFEDLTPAELSRRHRHIVKLGIGLLGAAIMGSLGALLGLVAGGLRLAPLLGLLFGLYGGLSLSLGQRVQSQPTQHDLRWNGVNATKGLIIALIGGPVFGLATGSVAVGVLMTPTLGLGLVVASLIDQEVVITEEIDEGRRASGRSVFIHLVLFSFFIPLFLPVVIGVSLSTGELSGPMGVLLVSTFLALLVALMFGPALAIHAGGWYLVLQRVVRRRAHRVGLLPEDPVKFIQAAVKVGILRPTGGGVQFRHRVIADRLAAEAPTPGLADLRPT